MLGLYQTGNMYGDYNSKVVPQIFIPWNIMEEPKEVMTRLYVLKIRALSEISQIWERQILYDLTYMLVTQSCPTLCDPVDWSPPGSSVHDHSPGKNTRVGSHFLLQGIFPTQGLNPDLPHCKQILYRISHQGSPTMWNLKNNPTKLRDTENRLVIPRGENVGGGKMSEWRQK